MVTKREQVSINKYSPSILLKIGVIINIIFASIMSLLLPLVIITVPAIVLNAMLLVPRVDTKRHFVWWRAIPVALIIILTSILVIAVLLVLGSLDDLYVSFATFVDKYIIFWTRKQLLPTDTSEYQAAIDLTAIILATVGGTGATLTMLGWYRAKEIGLVDAPEKKVVKEKKASSEKETKEKKITKKEVTTKKTTKPKTEAKKKSAK